MKKSSRKLRISITVTEYYKNREIIKTTRRVPAKIREIIKASTAQRWEIDIIYAPNKTNSFVRDSKKEVLEALSIFLEKDLIRSIIND